MKDDWSEDRVSQLATAWLAEIASSAGDDTGQQVVMMNFTASASTQWAFIGACVADAHTDEQLGAIAAGPLEHLMGKFGTDYIDRVEACADADPRFRAAVGHMWQYRITDDVCSRLQALGAGVQ
ncbi:DUF6869 domain-containing protein [Sphingopyxis sp. 22461]|uniref:DUF6869 domain-containing protein n=1 Tax=Sphingopyxis sp. 22461 TaxID=3453923 RepID=UPI003F85A996